MSRALAPVLLALAACAPGAPGAPPAATPWTPGTAWVAADRDGDALVELDAGLYVLGRQAVESPLWVRCGGGRTWVVHAPTGRPGGPQALVEWTLSGPRAALGVGEVLDLEVDAAGRALVLERDPSGDVHLTRAGAGGGCDLGAPPDAAGLGLGGAGPALALGRGGWALRGPTGRWSLHAGLDGAEVLDLEPGPRGGWWTLERLRGEPDALCVERGPDGAPRTVRPVGRARSLGRRTPRPWAWEPDERAVLPPNGVARTLAQAGARAAVGTEDGGLLVAAAGALLRLGPSGAPRPGQGGFARLVDVEWVGTGRVEPARSW